MPAWYDIPLQGNATVDNFDVEDANKYQKLPFFLVANEVKRFPNYKTWDVLFGKQKWTPNMGPIMRGVRPEYSPIGQTIPQPANITAMPQRNIFEVQESAEEARVKLQRFESKQFNFLPSFQDFWDNQASFKHDDLIRQISFYNETFIRAFAFARARNIMVAGNNGNQATLGTNLLLTGCPILDIPGDTGTLNGSKDNNWRAAVGQVINTTGLTLKMIHAAATILDEDLDAPTFEGTVNTPRDNELVKGKYVLITGTEAWRQFVWDGSLKDLRSINLDLAFDGFRGSLFGMVTTKAEKYPMRFDKNGNFVAPQITEPYTNDTGITTYKTRPNPQYIDMRFDTGAPFEVAWLVGADVCKTITVGPPPSDFVGQKMNASKFYSLRWNGEISLTDQCLIKYQDGSVDLNTYGTQLKLISQATMGFLPVEPNNILPIVFRRARINIDANPI